MASRFRDWLGCPECGERDDVSTLAHATDIVFECYGCGHVSEFVIGEDVPLQGLDPDTLTDGVDDQA